jgi:hypothetical protein
MAAPTRTFRRVMSLIFASPSFLSLYLFSNYFLMIAVFAQLDNCHVFIISPHNHCVKMNGFLCGNSLLAAAYTEKVEIRLTGKASIKKRRLPEVG